MDKKLAIVFPGQGSQRLGMLAELAAAYSLVEATFAEASMVLGYDLWSLSQTGPVEKLNQTQFTQPALLAAGVATWRVWRANGGRLPAYAAGHSLGEYTALVCASALEFNDAIKLVAQRGEFMQSAVPAGQGAMAAIIGLNRATLSTICVQAAQDEILSPANFNCPGQTVVAGTKTAVERAILLARAQGAKLAVIIPISVPAHCQLMRPAAKQLASVIEKITINAPIFPILHNIDASFNHDPQRIKQALIAQLYSPVNWLDTIKVFVNQGIGTIIECGPGKVLVNLNKRIDKNINNIAVFDVISLQHALTNFSDSVYAKER